MDFSYRVVPFFTSHFDEPDNQKQQDPDLLTRPDLEHGSVLQFCCFIVFFPEPELGLLGIEGWISGRNNNTC